MCCLDTASCTFDDYEKHNSVASVNLRVSPDLNNGGNTKGMIFLIPRIFGITIYVSILEDFLGSGCFGASYRHVSVQYFSFSRATCSSNHKSLSLQLV